MPAVGVENRGKFAILSSTVVELDKRPKIENGGVWSRSLRCELATCWCRLFCETERAEKLSSDFHLNRHLAGWRVVLKVRATHLPWDCNLKA